MKNSQVTASQLIKHFYNCKEIIQKSNNHSKNKVQQFTHHINNLCNLSQQDQTKKIQELLPILLKDIIIKHDECFGQFFDILLKKGVNLNFIEKKEEKCLLMIACAEGSVESVRMMLKEGVITSHKDVRNRSCLFYALDNRGGGGAGIEIMKMLLAADQSLVNTPANNNTSILFAAVDKGKSQYLRILLQKGAKPDECTTDQLDTPLHQTMRNLKNQKRQLVKNQLREMIKLLLKYGSNYNLKNKQGKTPIEIDPGQEQFMLNQIRITQQERSKQEKKPVTKDDAGSDTHKQSQDGASKLPSKQNKNFNESLGTQTPKQHKNKQKQKQKTKETNTNLMNINSRIQELKKSIEQLQTSINQMPKPILQLPSIPIDKLYIPDRQLQVYLSSEIEHFAQTIDNEKLVLQPHNDTIFQSIKQKLSEMNLTVHRFGSQSTGLNLDNNNIKISIVPGTNLTHDQQLIFINTIQTHLKKMGGLTELKLYKNTLSIEAVWRKTPDTEIAVILKFNRNKQAQQNRIEAINEYQRKYTQLKPLVYILKKLLKSVNLDNPLMGGLGTYGLVVLLTAFIKTQHELLDILDTEQISSGQILLSFLNTFGIDFDYLGKGIFLSQSQKGYMYNLDLKTIPKLVISDPLNQNLDLGVDINYTKILRNLFRISYFTLRINHQCYGKCDKKDRIYDTTKGFFEDKIKPCCILKRLFLRYSSDSKAK